jgi:hypothetical protein
MFKILLRAGVSVSLLILSGDHLHLTVYQNPQRTSFLNPETLYGNCP